MKPHLTIVKTEASKPSPQDDDEHKRHLYMQETA